MPPFGVGNYSAYGFFLRLLRHKNAWSVFEQPQAGPKGETQGCVE